MLNFLRKKLNKKVVVGVAIPYTKDQFDKVYERGNSDFLRSLSGLYKTDDSQTIWEKYSPTAKTGCDCLEKMKKRGAYIIPELTCERLQDIADADIAILVAHHSHISDEIEMSDCMVAVPDFVKAIPLEFKGLLDMSSCYSSSFQLSIKIRCPLCSTIAVRNKTPLQLRMQIYNYVINTLALKPDATYKEELKTAFSIVVKINNPGQAQINPDIVYLGGEITSSVYAPKQVEKGQAFLVQLAIHKNADSDMVEIMAREADGSTSLRNPLRLKLKLKTNDRIDIGLTIDSTDKNDFVVKRPRDFFYWENEPRFTNFTVFVSEQCKSKSCIATIKICVNKIPAGYISFRSEVISGSQSTKQSADIEFKNYDKKEEMNDAERLMLHLLESELGSLMSQPGENNPSERDIEICKNSINLLKDKGKNKHNKVYKVFISSTSDLKEFRDVMEQRVLECSMYPEMYEKWPQKDKSPRDYCIEKVLMSDIFVCILGPNYGYVEPRINTSMTEIEFRVALLSGKPILVYVLNNYEEKMLSYLPEHQMEVDKQRMLINELNKKRMIEFFNDPSGLSLISTRELTIIQKELEHERIN